MYTRADITWAKPMAAMELPMNSQSSSYNSLFTTVTTALKK